MGDTFVEAIDSVIVARIVGEVSEAVVRERHASVIALVRQTGIWRVVYDVRRAHVPTAISDDQRQFNSELAALAIKLAVVVSDRHIAYLARQTFFGLPHRVFYGDIDAAIAWLEESV